MTYFVVLSLSFITVKTECYDRL